MTEMMKKEIELILSGGNVSAISYLGLLHRLIELKKIDLDRIVKYTGTSAGALFGLLLSLGYSPLRIKDVIMKLPFHKFVETSIDKWIVFFDTLGLNSQRQFQNMLNIFLEHIGFETNITFREHYEKTGKKLILTTYCLNSKNVVYLNHETTPKLSIVTGALMSMAVPLLFQPVRYQSRYYVDAFLVQNFPVSLAEPDKYESIGLNICYCHQKEYEENLTLMAYLKILFISATKKQEEYDANMSRVSIYTIHLQNLDLNNCSDFMHIESEHVEKLFSCGYSSLEAKCGFS